MGVICRAFRFGNHSELQWLVLGVTFAETIRDLCTRRFYPEIKCVTRISARIEMRIELEGIIRYVVPVSIVDMDAIFGYLDPIIEIADL